MGHFLRRCCLLHECYEQTNYLWPYCDERRLLLESWFETLNSCCEKTARLISLKLSTSTCLLLHLQNCVLTSGNANRLHQHDHLQRIFNDIISKYFIMKKVLRPLRFVLFEEKVSWVPVKLFGFCWTDTFHSSESKATTESSQRN